MDVRGWMSIGMRRFVSCNVCVLLLLLMVVVMVVHVSGTRGIPARPCHTAAHSHSLRRRVHVIRLPRARVGSVVIYVGVGERVAM